jgi:acetate kinase
VAGAHHILCLNAGSSSLKAALYRLGEGEETLLARGAAEGLGLGEGRLWLQGAGEMLMDTRRAFGGHREAVRPVFAAFEDHGLPMPAAAGHRIVHGGPTYVAPVRIDSAVLSALRRLVPLAPLHLPSEIALIEAVEEHAPDLPQVACFDTAFHSAMPERARRFPLPRALYDQGVRRYGFHGISYEYIVQRLRAELPGRTVIAHLGNGASLAAVKEGRSQDTTMGLTPLGGVMMGTRSGDLDPGVALYLLRERGLDAAGLERLLARESGLLGVSGATSDMQALLAARDRDPHAAEAVGLFCDSVRKHVGALATVLDGLDTLVFTGGIGENAAPVRWEICQGLEHLGVQLDEKRNAAHAEIVSSAQSRCTVRVIATQEDLMIARHTRDLLFGDAG